MWIPLKINRCCNPTRVQSYSTPLERCNKTFSIVRILAKKPQRYLPAEFSEVPLSFKHSRRAVWGKNGMWKAATVCLQASIRTRSRTTTAAGFVIDCRTKQLPSVAAEQDRSSRQEFRDMNRLIIAALTLCAHWAAAWGLWPDGPEWTHTPSSPATGR